MKMIDFRHVNPTYLSLLLIGLIILVTVCSFFFITGETDSAIEKSVKTRLITIANLTASNIDGDTLEHLNTGDEESAGFFKIRDYLHAIKESDPDIAYVYTMRKNGDSLEFVVDGDNGYTSEPFFIGEPYEYDNPDMFAGFEAPTTDKTFVTDKWGTTLSGYAPIRNRSGLVIGIVGVDMNSTKVMEHINNLNKTYFFLGLVILLLVICGLLFNEKRRIEDSLIIKESDDRLRAFIEQILEGVVILDEKGQIIEWNPAQERITGILKPDAMGRYLWDLPTNNTPDEEQREEISNRVRNDIEMSLRSDESTRPYSSNYSIFRPDGTIATIHTLTFILKTQKRRMLGVINLDVTEHRLSEDALNRIREKLNVLNSVTFNEIQNAIFSLQGYIDLTKSMSDDAMQLDLIERENAIVKRISAILDFSKYYQDLGVHSPKWQSVNQVYIFAISHLDLTQYSRHLALEGVEIFADPMLEKVFYSLAINVIHHGQKATRIEFTYQETPKGLLLIFEDDGAGIEEERKESIFERGVGSGNGMDLFLVREILGITGISIHENGIPGKGARFEILVPRIAYRIQNREE